jgi:hypothetical protein
MGKGIITSDPTPTHVDVMVVVSGDPNFPQKDYYGKELRADPPAFPLKKGDTVEMAIESQTQCRVDAKFMGSIGKVTLGPIDGRGGKVLITMAENEIWFNFFPVNPQPFPTKQDDTIEFLIIDDGGTFGGALFVKVLQSA